MSAKAGMEYIVGERGPEPWTVRDVARWFGVPLRLLGSGRMRRHHEAYRRRRRAGAWR